MDHPLRSASGSGKPTELAFCHAKSNERKNKMSSFAVWEIHAGMRLTVVREVVSRVTRAEPYAESSHQRAGSRRDCGGPRLRWEFWLSIVCLAGVAVLGAIPGIGLAIAIAVIEFLWDGWRPHFAVLGHVIRAAVDAYVAEHAVDWKP
jgi:hypothetical protein